MGIRKSKQVLPVIMISQFFCTSMWFAGNAVMTDLINAFQLESNALSHLTSAVQFGFICGTLTYAIFTIADRFSPSRVFLFSALAGGLFNLAIVIDGQTFTSLLLLRFFTGFFLAGIYPVGMKIAADHYEKGLGRSLGLLVGALVIGTSFPHILKGMTGGLSWRSVLALTTAFAAVGGALMAVLVPDGPHRTQGQKPDLAAFFRVFKNKALRSAAFGYFGHMWELYTFWAFIPIILITYRELHPGFDWNISLWSFFIIASGGLACIIAGYLSQYLGTKRTAFIALFLSGACCLLSPLVFLIPSGYVLGAFLLFWGMTVVADSPLFSTLVAQNASASVKGTALIIVNCIGFSITIVSIQLMSLFREWIGPTNMYVILAIGPILGLLALYEKSKPN